VLSRECPALRNLDLETTQRSEHQRAAFIADATASPVRHPCLDDAQLGRRFRDGAVAFDQQFNGGLVIHGDRYPPSRTRDQHGKIIGARYAIPIDANRCAPLTNRLSAEKF
jgi:hypothetical protein